MVADGVPTATPFEMTYRVGWEVIEWVPEQVTVRAKRCAEPDAGDSDGIPQAVVAEVSLRGSSEQVTDRADIARFITPELRLKVLSALAEMSFRDGLDVLDTPFLVTPEPGKEEVCFCIRRFKGFQKWFDELAQFDFADIERAMGRVDGSLNWFHQRRAGLQVLHELAKLLPTLQQFDDMPHVILHL